MDDVMYLIAGAVKEAARLNSDGVDLQTALVKVASDRDLTIEQTKRVVEGLNTLNTLDMFKAGHKTAEFPVADIRDVIAAAFAEKAAQAMPLVYGPPPMEYMIAEVSRFVPHQERLMLKQAHAVLDATPSPKTYDRDPHELAQMVGIEIDMVEKRAWEHEVAAERGKDGVLAGMEKLAESFQRYGSPTVSRFIKDAMALWGDQGRDYLRVLTRMVPEKFHGSPVEKSAALIDDTSSQHRLFRHVLESGADHAHNVVQAQELRKQAEVWKEGLRAAFFSQREKRGASVQDIEDRAMALGGPDFTQNRARYMQMASQQMQKEEEPGPSPAQQEIARLQETAGLASAQRAVSPQMQQIEEGKVQEEMAKLRDSRAERRSKAMGQPLTTMREGVALGSELGGAASQAMSGIADAAKGFPTQVFGGIGALEPVIGPAKAYDYYDQLGESLRMQSSIQQVLDEDPILADRSSDELMPIIQTLIQVAPDVVSHPPALASILRQATSGQYEVLDPLTLSQLAEAQQNIWKGKEVRKRQIMDQPVQLRL